MQKTVLTRAVALALATMGAGTAFAQSSLTLYGNLDIAYTNVSKKAGDVSGTLLPAASFATKSTVNGISSSVSSVNAIGIRGTEDIGGGYKGNFVLEGQMQVDTGAQSGQDGRMWGRQAYVGLTTPFGEVRLGRQYAPMFYAFATTTVEALGGADLQAVGLATNNLQVRQDNQVSYWIKSGGLTASLSYTPNAGVADRISSSRAITNNVTSSSGQILGGQSSGSETDGERGRSYGLFVNYSMPMGLMLSGAFNRNEFAGTPVGPNTQTGFNYFNAEQFDSFVLAAKYTVPNAGTVVSAQWHQSELETSIAANGVAVLPGPTNLPLTAIDIGDVKIRTISLGVKQPIGNFAVGLQLARTEFTNFTEGKNTAFMLIGDYNLSKRTRVYIRAGQMKDDRGRTVAYATPAAPVVSPALAGGPFPLLTGLGSLETPFFSGGGANIDAKTTVVGVGIRHQF
ncbi:MAG: porin [Aquabacterium sp.]